MRNWKFTLISAALAALSFTATAEAAESAWSDLPCSPTSQFVVPFSSTLPAGTRAIPESSNPMPADEAPDLGFCSKWNPEFGYRKNFCCANRMLTRKEKKCPASRWKTSFCSEMTEEQRFYVQAVKDGKISDVLKILGPRPVRAQAYCSVNDGFLAYGRPLVPTATNRIRIRNTDRCTFFGTDAMVAMLEWTGRRVAEVYSDPKYSKLEMMIGDIAAPRGGCLSGRGGRRGHASHTNGQDVDIGFLTPLANRGIPPNFHKQFDVRANYWAIKQVFSNPYACVRVIFLDRRLIGKLANIGRGDPDWLKIRGYIHHARGHRNHFHVRIGRAPGAPGCQGIGDAGSGDEPEEEVGGDDAE